MDDLQVRVSEGVLQGTLARTIEGGAPVRVFKGIPYAAAPTGDRRWRPPSPPASWQGVRSALNFSDDCPQSGDVGSRAPGQSEDCLYLNVWTPKAAKPGSLPVMVWIHGGSFVAGSGSEIRLDGAKMTARDVVIVTINYRLGIFGFLAHPQLTKESSDRFSGNYALLDQLAALRWIKENISAFGGDPGQVTVFGVSAGSASIALLLTSPLVKGLFQKTILESPGTARPLASLEMAETAGLAVGDDISALRSESAASVFAKTSRLAPPVRGLTTPRILRPIRDGFVIPTDERPAFKAGRLMQIEVLLGTNQDEGTEATAPWPFKTIAQYNELLQANFGSFAERARDLYPAASDQEVPLRVAELFADTQFNYGTRLLALTMAQRNIATWRYVFRRRRPAQTDGPHHGEEVTYVFGTLENARPEGISAFDDTDHKLSEAMMTAWIAFARTGNPNEGSNIDWPRYDVNDDAHLEIGDTIHRGQHWRRSKLDFLEEFYSSRA